MNPSCFESNWPTLNELREAVAATHLADRERWVVQRPLVSAGLLNRWQRPSRMSSYCVKRRHGKCAMRNCICACHRGGLK